MPAAAAACATSRTATYRRRQPERTVLYRTVQTHLATWLELAQDESERSAPAHVEREFRGYLECGILAHGFAPVVQYPPHGRDCRPSCRPRPPALTGSAMGAFGTQAVALLPANRPRRPEPGPAYLSVGGGTGATGRLPGGRQQGPHRCCRLYPPLWRSAQSACAISTAWWLMACSRPGIVQPPEKCDRIREGLGSGF